MGTTYIYDIPELFKGAIAKEWAASHDADNKPPKILVTADELVLNQIGELEKSNRLPGSNDCGMVAWEMIIYTPEYPEGRHLILIGNFGSLTLRK